MPSGWHHVAIVRSKDHLTLYVDGRQVAQSSVSGPVQFDLSGGSELRIGFGPNDYFNGRLADLRLYQRALNPKEILSMSGSRYPGKLAARLKIILRGNKY